MNIKDFEHDDWVKIWDGGWSFLTCSHFAEQYTKEIIFGKKPFQTQSILFSAKGRSSAWMRQNDRDILGQYLSSQIKNTASVKVIAVRLKFQAKDFLKFITKTESTAATQNLYNEFWKRLCVYYKAHIHVKYVVDYLDPKSLQRYLPILEEARLVAEPVLNKSEDFMVSFAKILSKETGYDNNLILCLTKFEIDIFFRQNILPKKNELQQRYKNAAMLYNNKVSEFYYGLKVKNIEKLIKQKSNKTFVQGTTAYGGVVQGVARVVTNPKTVKIFKAGDILITGSTRPEFLALMHKAAAFVTDAGGILSHAAITARELKKPCVIGTKNATKIFKDGDIIEVNADKRMVKIIKK